VYVSNLIIIFGPPASGKAAIGHELAARTGYRFFHNHLTADPVAALFGCGTPRFGPLVDAIRDVLFREAAGDSSIKGVVFTFVWDLDHPADKAFVSRTAQMFKDAGGETYLVELQASLQTRIEREGTPFRLALKPAQRDVDAARVRQVDTAARYRMNTSQDEVQAWPHIRIDTESMNPEAAALRVMQAYALQSIDA
jgi:hypothetical protein